MDSIVTLDSTGRVVIPKTLRETLRLECGDVLSVESDGESVTLRPVRAEQTMRREQGIWVFRSGKRISADETDEALAGLRKTRSRSLANSKR